MLITPQPGTDDRRLLDSLRSVHRSVTVLRGAGGPAEADKRLLAYLDWANVAVQMLAKQISDADLHILVLTKQA